MVTITLPYGWQQVCVEAARTITVSDVRLSLNHIPQVDEQLGEHGWVKGILPLDWAVKPEGAWWLAITNRGAYAVYVSPGGKAFGDA